MQVSLVTKTKCDGVRKPHTHANEQWNYIVKGTLKVKIGDQPEQLCGPGTLLYFPANVVHSTAPTPEEDVVSSRSRTSRRACSKTPPPKINRKARRLPTRGGRVPCACCVSSDSRHTGIAATIVIDT